MEDRKDGEIHADALADWQGVIAGLWDACGKSLELPTEQARFQQYVRQLSGIPLGLLQLACDRAVREQGRYLTVPPIGSIWEAVRKELGNPYDLDQAIAQWCEARFSSACLLYSEGSEA